MKVEKRNSASTRRVLIGMITDTAVCAGIAAKWNGRLFLSRHDNLVAGWCVRHYTKFRKAPGKNIAGYFDRWSETKRDAELVQSIENFLSSLSSQSKEKLSSQYLLDLADEVFNRTMLEELRDEITAGIQSGEISKVVQKVEKFNRIEMGLGSTDTPLKDPAVVRTALSDMGDTLVKWDQKPLRQFFQRIFSREEFIAFIGKEKVGKSFWLQELSIQSVMNKRRTAFFEVGDQSRNQIIRRFAARLAGRPFRADEGCRYPVKMVPGDPPTITHEYKKFDQDMSPDEAEKAMLEFGKQYGASRLRMSVHPNMSISARGIDSILERWKESEKWVPDVVVVDYADILAPIDGKTESRDQINANWATLRQISQKYHCCVVTATQSDAASYDAKTLGRGNFTGDKRKNAHITAQVGINQTTAEQESGIARLNIIHGRDLEFSSEKCIYVATHLGIAQPAAFSSF